MSLKGVIGEVLIATDTIADFSQILAADNAAFSGRTEAKAGSLIEAAAAMEQLTGTGR